MMRDAVSGGELRFAAQRLSSRAGQGPGVGCSMILTDLIAGEYVRLRVAGMPSL